MAIAAVAWLSLQAILPKALQLLALPANALLMRLSQSSGALMAKLCTVLLLFTLVDTDRMPAEKALAMCRVLSQEPLALQGALLASLDEQERHAVLRYWPAGIRSRPSLVTVPTWTPTLRDAVLATWHESAEGSKA